MAITKEVNIVVKESGMDKVNQSIQQLENSIEQTELKTKSFKTQMREANEQVRLMSQRFGETSIQAVQAARKVAELKDQMDLANDLVKQFNPDQKFKALGAATQLAGTGLQGVTAGVALLGDESEETQKALLQVQAAMSFSDAISNLSNLGDQWKVLKTTIMANTVVTKIATTVQKLWNLAMAANPIGALVAVISLAIAGIAGLVSWFVKSSNANEKAMNATKKNSDALKKQTEVTEKNEIALKKNNDQQYELAKASGKSSEELRKLNIKHAQETIALNVKNAELARGTFLRERDTLAMLEASGASDEVIEKQKELTQKSYEELKKQNENIKKSSEEYKAIRRQNEVEIVNEKTESNKKAIEDGKTARQKEIDDAKQKAEEEEKQRNDLATARGENAREQLENLQKIEADIKKANQDILKTENELQVEEENARYESLKQKMIDANISTIELEKEHKRNLAKLNDEYFVTESDKAVARTAKQKEIDDKATSDKLKNAELLAQQQNEFANNVFSIGAGLAKKGSKVAKGVAIAQATMNTYQGVTKALAETTDPTPSQTLRFANAAAVGIMGAINIAKIASSREDGGTSGGMGSGGGAAPQSPSFNLVQGTGRNQLAESIGQQAPVKAFVVARDMSTGQEMDRNIIKSASL
jgi:hypothetical protein